MRNFCYVRPVFKITIDIEDHHFADSACVPGATGNARCAREPLSIDDFPGDRLTRYRSPGTFFSIEIWTYTIAFEECRRV